MLKIRQWNVLTIVLIGLSTAILFQNCAGGNSSSPTPGNSLTEDESSVTLASSYIVNNGNKIAHVMGIEAGYATVYIPTVDRYTRVSLLTGEYQKAWAYYSGPSCTGDITVTSIFPGEIGKSIIFFNGRYYRITDEYPGQFSYRSMFVVYDYPTPSAPGGCTSLSSSQPLGSRAYVFEEVARPYDFESLAPLKVQFK